VVLVSLICLNVVCIVLESVGTIRVAYGALFRTVEMISVAVFSFEYLARIWSSPDIADRNYADSILGRCRYALTPAAIVDLLAIAPFYLSVFVGVDLRFLRVIQLLRVLKLTSYSATMQSILQVFRDESNAFVATFCLLLVILVLASSGIYVFEHEAEPDKFSSIPAAMWWAMATRHADYAHGTTLRRRHHAGQHRRSRPSRRHSGFGFHQADAEKPHHL
jgi:voltage-gated potassium channel